MTLHNEINAVRVHVAWMPARQKRWKPLSYSAKSVENVPADLKMKYIPADMEGMDIGEKTRELKKMGNKIYGCDECLKACPWNRFATPCRTAEFQPSPSLLSMRKDDWHSLSEEQYKTIFKGSAVKRAKYGGLMRNIKIIK